MGYSVMGHMVCVHVLDMYSLFCSSSQSYPPNFGDHILLYPVLVESEQNKIVMQISSYESGLLFMAEICSSYHSLEHYNCL